MNKALVVKGLPLILLFVLTACSGGGGGLCSSAAEGSLAPTCSPPRPEPLFSPVGSWQGTLTVMKFPSPTVLFTAEITTANQTEYEGVFTLGDASYDVTGYFVGIEGEGERFVFEAPLSEVQAMESPTVPSPPGYRWSGVITQDTYQGGEFQIFQDAIEPLQIGEFVLERRP